jgi:hypothetical protein
MMLLMDNHHYYNNRCYDSICVIDTFAQQLTTDKLEQQLLNDTDQNSCNH